MNTAHRRLLSPTLVAFLSVSALPLECFGFAEVARGALTLETEARLTYDSYFIGGNTGNDDDYFATLNPTLRYARRAGLAELSGFAGLAVMRYDENSQYDSENFSAGISTTLPVSEGSRISGSFSAGYRESTVVDYDVMDRVPTKGITANALLRYRLGLKTSLSDSFTYANTDRSSYSDQETFTNDFSFLYSDFLEGTSLRLTHSYMRTTSTGLNVLNADLDQDSNSLSASLSRPIVGQLRGEVTYGYRVLDRSGQENFLGQTKIEGGFFSATLMGPFLPPSLFPKVESSASLRYSEAPSPGINDVGEKTLTGNMHVGWSARERTTLTFDASRSVDLTATDLSVENTRINFGITQEVGLATSLRGSVGYTWRDYRGIDRGDETFEASLTANYRLTRYWSAGASYSYQKNEADGDPSTFPLATNFRTRQYNYERHLVSIYATNVF